MDEPDAEAPMKPPTGEMADRSVRAQHRGRPDKCTTEKAVSAFGDHGLIGSIRRHTVAIPSVRHRA